MEFGLGHIFSTVLAGLLVSLVAKTIIGKSLDQLEKIGLKVIEIDKKLVGIDVKMIDIANIKSMTMKHDRKLVELEMKIQRLNGGSHLYSKTIPHQDDPE